MLTQLEINHGLMVAQLIKPGQEIIDSLTPGSMTLLHMAVGVSGESGELLDAIKKVVMYNKDIDRENVIEELGDLEFYIQGLRQCLNISRDECLAHNIVKLSTGPKARYKDGYSDGAAQARTDKA